MAVKKGIDHTVSSLPRRPWGVWVNTTSLWSDNKESENFLSKQTRDNLWEKSQRAHCLMDATGSMEEFLNKTYTSFGDMFSGLKLILSNTINEESVRIQHST